MNDVIAVFIRENHQCFLCSSNKSLETHHIIPTRLKGDNSYKNLIVLCKKCHRQKVRQKELYYAPLFFAYTSRFKNPIGWDRKAPIIKPYKQHTAQFAKDNEEEMELHKSVAEYCFKENLKVSVYIKKLFLRDSLKRERKLNLPE